MPVPFGAIRSGELIQTVRAMTPPLSATMNLSYTTANTFVWSTSIAQTINFDAVPPQGGDITFIITNSGSNLTPRLVTFGAKIASTGTVSLGAGKTLTIRFVSDGTRLVELARSVV